MSLETFRPAPRSLTGQMGPFVTTVTRKLKPEPYSHSPDGPGVGNNASAVFRAWLLPAPFAERSMNSHDLCWASLEDLCRRRDSLAGETRNIKEERSGIERKRRRTPSGKRGKKPIKYRGPEPGQTWAGRGHVPRWMREYIKQGIAIDHWLVSRTHQ